MPDREKVIRLIEEEIRVCESVNQCYRTIDLPALRDILALLKEQEAVVPIQGEDIWKCGYCGDWVGYEVLAVSGPEEVRYNYCPTCGMKVKWE